MIINSYIQGDRVGMGSPYISLGKHRQLPYIQGAYLVALMQYPKDLFLFITHSITRANGGFIWGTTYPIREWPRYTRTAC